MLTAEFSRPVVISGSSSTVRYKIRREMFNVPWKLTGNHGKQKITERETKENKKLIYSKQIRVSIRATKSFARARGGVNIIKKILSSLFYHRAKFNGRPTIFHRPTCAHMYGFQKYWGRWDIRHFGCPVADLSQTRPFPLVFPCRIWSL